MKKMKYIIIRRKALYLLSMIAITCLFGAMYSYYAIGQEKNYIYKVVVDAGHGGKDPGKESSDNIKEKDINLSVALKLQMLLEEAKVQVIMTRTEDIGLHSEDASNKQRDDLQRRVQIMSEAKPDMAVSIHQNSYTSADCKGAQTFYYEGSTEGQALAETVQNELIEQLEPSNTRKAKGNTSYYLLKKSDIPVIIVEAGFLSNPEETLKLIDEGYQDKIAKAIFDGMMKYLQEHKNT